MSKKIQDRMPLILAVETSGRAGSVAIAHGPVIVDSARFSAPMRHSAELFVSIMRLLEKADLTPRDINHIYVSQGPGSFTGIRIAVTMAKTLNFANDVKIAAVNTLDVIAANANDYIRDKRTTISRIATILDAKRGQFFVAAYRHAKTGWTKTDADCLMAPADFVRQFDTEPIWLLGEGLVYYSHLFVGENILILGKEYWPAKAEKVHELGWRLAGQDQFADPLKLIPLYLRGHEAVPKQKL
jgi:tRNA threonylcarbamoyladenosine biosynthesis protein TsaB